MQKSEASGNTIYGKAYEAVENLTIYSQGKLFYTLRYTYSYHAQIK